MSGEMIIQDGVSGWQTVATGLSLSAATWAQVHATNTIASLMAATEEDYPEFDMQISVTTGTPGENGTLEICLRPKADGTNAQPAPSGAFAQHRLGQIVLDNTASSYFYGFGLPNYDKNGTLYLKSPTAITVTVKIRMRSLNTAA